MSGPKYDFCLDGRLVEACHLLDHQIDITIEGGAWFRVEAPCVVRLGGADYGVDPGLTVASPNLDRLAVLVGTVLGSVVVDHTDTLVLTTDDGPYLVVPSPRDGYEAWAAGSRGSLVISMGDGHLEFLDPPGRTV